MQEKEELAAQLRGSKDREKQTSLEKDLKASKERYDNLKHHHDVLSSEAKRLGRTLKEGPGGKRVLESAKVWADRTIVLIERAHTSGEVWTQPCISFAPDVPCLSAARWSWSVRGIGQINL